MSKMVKEIVITGPESTGKSTLAENLAGYYKDIWVPEYARTYLRELGRPYRKGDLTKIAKGQWSLQKQYLKKAKRFIFYDTSMLIIKVWSTYKYGTCTKWIEEHFKKQKVDLYVLTKTDLPWEYDPLRENPDDRDKLFEIYKEELTKYDKPFIEVGGLMPEERMRGVIDALG